MSVSRIPVVEESEGRKEDLNYWQRGDNKEIQKSAQKRKSLNEWQKIKSGGRVNEVLSRSRGDEGGKTKRNKRIKRSREAGRRLKREKRAADGGKERKREDQQGRSNNPWRGQHWRHSPAHSSSVIINSFGRPFIIAICSVHCALLAVLSAAGPCHRLSLP